MQRIFEILPMPNLFRYVLNATNKRLVKYRLNCIDAFKCLSQNPKSMNGNTNLDKRNQQEEGSYTHTFFTLYLIVTLCKCGYSYLRCGCIEYFLIHM